MHQNNQIQNFLTTSCGYFCLYFLNEMNKGQSYLDLLNVFDIHDTMKNERFIEIFHKYYITYIKSEILLHEAEKANRMCSR